MKHTSSRLTVACLLFTALITTGAPLLGQGNPLPVRPQLPGLAGSLSAPASATLKTNYRITLAGKGNGKAMGEISYLTCSARTGVSGPLSDVQPSTSISATGELTERDDGTLLWTYGLTFSVPTPTQTITMPGQEAKAITTSIQYLQHNTQGSLILKPGKAYEMLTVAGVTYTVTIAAESETK